MMKVDVLGTEYTLVEVTEDTDTTIAGRDGYCDTSIKMCAIDKMENKGENAKKNLQEYKKTVKRHELIHAFLYESGLDNCCYWAENEEMVDWLAIQFPKMLKAFQDVDAI